MRIYITILLTIICLLVILVVRLSEVSTRMHTIEQAAMEIADDNYRIMTTYVTDEQLKTILKYIPSLHR